MGKTADTLKWTWKNKKWVVPTAAILGTIIYFNGGDEAIDTVERNASAVARAGSGYENAGSDKTAAAIAGLVCKSAVVKTEDGKPVMHVITNHAMPNNAKLEVSAHHPSIDGWKDTWRQNFGEPGEPFTELSTRRGPVDAAETVITLGNAEVACPAWHTAS
jgi:hypothetical protein